MIAAPCRGRMPAIACIAFSRVYYKSAMTSIIQMQVILMSLTDARTVGEVIAGRLLVPRLVKILDY